ncbi:hypothetical protein FGO68_gene17202 [Halteria grandinella]|uniref:RRM domain-containing protein n=1 Tax=Halteria grandinella TaxID=5974 RepID=A0A8J8NIX3_HALGN|nr:hypothetical protein FGO68_gene17202 [Halteria grandinella]
MFSNSSTPKHLPQTRLQVPSQSHLHLGHQPVGPLYTSHIQQQGVQSPSTIPPAASSCIFIGNIPYDAPDTVLTQILASVGPFNVFRLKLDKESGQPKGFGFVEYRTEDLASSALRNLNKYELNRRELKVDYASDGKNGVNLRAEDVRGRDQGEIIEETPSKGIVMPSQVSMHQLYWRELRGPYSSEMDTFNRTDLIKCLTNTQEMMLLQAIKDVYEQTVKQEPQAVERLVDVLANDEVALETLSKILDRHLSAQGYKK